VLGCAVSSEINGRHIPMREQISGCLGAMLATIASGALRPDAKEVSIDRFGLELACDNHVKIELLLALVSLHCLSDCSYFLVVASADQADRGNDDQDCE